MSVKILAGKKDIIKLKIIKKYLKIQIIVTNLKKKEESLRYFLFNLNYNLLLV